MSDLPYVIELCGGQNDGLRQRVARLAPEYRCIEQLDLTTPASLAVATSVPPPFRTASYVATGKRRADGTCVYAFNGYTDL